MKISELPDEYRKLAEKRREEDNGCLEQDSLSCCFYWKFTPEGRKFWDAVDSAKTPDQLPPIPETSK